jgi:hypothetical protein
MFKPNRSLERELERQRQYTIALMAAAAIVKREAEARAHRIMPRNPDAFEIQVRGLGRVTLANTDYGGHLEEWGSANNPPHAPLRTGVRAVPGLRLEEDSKA